MNVSISDLLYFTCRRAWLWGKSYLPKKPNIYFWVGSGVHAGLDGYYKSGRKSVSGLITFEKWLGDSYKGLSGSFVNWEEDRKPFDEAADLCRKLLQNFFQYDQAAKPMILQGNIVGTEKFLSHKLPNGVNLRGKVDLILKDPDKRLHIVDHKTFGERSIPTWETLDVDGQLTGYCYLVWKAYGEIPRSVGYNIILKTVPEPPPVLKNGRLSVSKSQGTTAALYREKLNEMGFVPSDGYEEILSYLEAEGWALFFKEMPTTRNVTELEAFERRAVAISEDMKKCYENPDEYAYPIPSTYNCKYCDYVVPCKAKDDGSDFLWMLQEMFTSKSLY